MNKIGAIIFVSIFVVVLQMTDSERIPELEENDFYKINIRLQDTVNKVFILMKLDKRFATEYKNRMLLGMHASMKSIAENNYDVLKKVNESSRANVTIKPKDHLFNLDVLLDNLLKNYTPPDVKHIIRGTISKLLLGKRLLEIPDDVEDSFMLLREYLNNVQNIDIGDIAAMTKHPTIHQTLEYKKHHLKRKRNYHHHLKLWKAPNETRRLFDGRQVKIKKYPFVASVHVQGEFVCTGCILSDDMIITAASCLQVVFNNRSFLQYNPEGVAVRIGSNYADRMGGKIYIDKVFFHPGYDPSSLRSNLAIVRISQRLHLKKNKKIKRIGFQRMEGQIPPTIKDIFVLGWGTKGEEKVNDMTLSYTRLDIYDLNDCMTIYTKKFVSDKNFCAGFTTKRSGACQRDIGGPGVVGSTLMGVVSFGPPVCGTPDAPTVFTNIGYFIEWIDGILSGNPLTIQLPAPTTPIQVTSKSKPRRTSSVTSSRISRQKRIARTHSLTTTTSVTTSRSPKPEKPQPPVKKTHKIIPKAVRLLRILLSEIMDYDYEDDDLVTNPDSHLWTTTTFNPFMHPLLNKSLFGLDEEEVNEITTNHTDFIVLSTKAELFFPAKSGVPLSYIARDAHNGQVQMYEEMGTKGPASSDSDNDESQGQAKSQSESKSEEEGLSIEIPKSYIKYPAGSFPLDSTEQPPVPPPPLRMYSYTTEPTTVNSYRLSRTTPMEITIPFGVKYRPKRRPTYPPTKKRIPNRYVDPIDTRAADILNNNFVRDQQMETPTERKLLKVTPSRMNRYRFVITKNDGMKNILRKGPREPATERYYNRASKARSKPTRKRLTTKRVFKTVRQPDKDVKPLLRAIGDSGDVPSCEFAAILNESASLDDLMGDIQSFMSSTRDFV